MRFWLSFADSTRPKSQQFLGVAIVSAMDISGALTVSHVLGINPGGEVAYIEVDESVAGLLSFSLEPYHDRLLPPSEARELHDRIGKDLDQ